MIYFFILIGFLIICAAMLENKTKFDSYKEVKERRNNGDFSCEVERTFYGYRVKELAECDL